MKFGKFCKECTFQGYEAIFDTRLDGQERVRVLLQMLNDRRVLVEMHVGQIAKKK